METLQHVQGLADLHRAMQALPAKLEANLIRGASRAGAKVIADEAKRRVPVQSGALRDSIRVSVKLDHRRGRVVATIKAGSNKTKKVIESRPDGGIKVRYLNPFYARFVEKGTSTHYIKAVTAKALILRRNRRASSGFAKRWTAWVVEGVTHPGARPKPFMAPAFTAKSQAALAAFADYLRRRIPVELKKAA